MSARGIFYGWWIVAAVFLVLVAEGGAYYSFGVFFKPLQTEMGWTRVDLSWGIFLQLVIQGFSLFLTGVLLDKYGTHKVIPPFAILLFAGYVLLGQISTLWQLYLFYGVLIGVGLGLGFAPLSSIVARWFSQRKGLALGIALSGVNVGTIIIPPLISYIILHVGWRVAFPIIGLIILVAFLIAALVLRRDPQEKGLAPYGYHETRGAIGYSSYTPSGLTLSEALRNRQLWVLIVVCGAFFLGQQMVMFHIVNYATDMGIEAILAASILSSIALGSLIGRLATGTLSDIVGLKRLFFFCIAGMAILFPWLILIRSMVMFTVFGLIFGFLYGGMIPLPAVLASRLFGTRALGAIFGAVSLGIVEAAALGPLVAGYIFDSTQSYYYAFALASVLISAAALLSLTLRTKNYPFQ